jgi:hypothetical protein
MRPHRLFHLFSPDSSSSLCALAALLCIGASAALLGACGDEDNQTTGSGGAGPGASSSSGGDGLGGGFVGSSSSTGGPACSALDPAGGAPTFVKAYGDATAQSGVAVNVDKAGNVLLAGAFQGTMNLGAMTLTSAGAYDVFIAKFSPAGELLWAKSFGDASNQQAQGIAADANGNVFVTGTFVNNINFGGGTLTSNTQFFQDVFLAKFAPDGTHVFSQRFGGSDIEDVYSLAVDASGNAILAGAFQLSVDFGGGTIVSKGLFDAYVAKFGPSGTLMWVKQFGDAAEQKARSVSLDAQGNLLLAGQAAGSIDFGGGETSAPGNPSAFAAKLDPNGGHLWSKVWGSLGKASVNAISPGPGGQMALAGAFTGSITFGSEKWENSNVDDGFVVVLGPSGEHVWSRRFGDDGAQAATAVAITAAGDVLLAGGHTGVIDLGAGPITSKEGFDGFLAKFDTSGCPRWVRSYGGPLVQSPLALTFNPVSGGALVTGSFSGAVDFGAGPVQSNGDDVFLLAVGP